MAREEGCRGLEGEEIWDLLQGWIPDIGYWILDISIWQNEGEGALPKGLSVWVDGTPFPGLGKLAMNRSEDRRVR